MLSIRQVEALKAAKPRTYNRATIDQKHLLADTVEKELNSGLPMDKAIKKAYRAVRFNRVEISDCVFDTVGSMRVGGGR